MGELKCQITDMEKAFGESVRIIKNELSNVESDLEELGVWSFKKAFEEFVLLIRRLASDNPKMCSFKGLADSLEHVYSQYVEKLLPKDEEDKILSYSSEKFRALFHWLKAKMSEKHVNFKTIVFVERMSTAFYINRLFSALSQKFTFIKSDLEWIEAPMDSKKQVLISLIVELIYQQLIFNYQPAAFLE